MSSDNYSGGPPPSICNLYFSEAKQHTRYRKTVAQHCFATVCPLTFSMSYQDRATFPEPSPLHLDLILRNGRMSQAKFPFQRCRAAGGEVTATLLSAALQRAT